jgi:two-component system, NtrC family, sensor kinase
MERKTPKAECPGQGSPEGEHKAHYKRLFRRYVGLTLFCSLLPLLLVGWGINIHYTRLARNRMISSFQNEVGHHRTVIGMFLKELSSKLQLVARTHDRDYLTDPAHLNVVFALLNQQGWAIADLGVIDQEGRHLSYIGPYDLMDKNYAKTDWFRQVMERGLFISDMFMGFRAVPHFVIAVTGDHHAQKWILRATVDTEAFRSLVENVHIGKTGEVYLLNAQGIYQTKPRFSGDIMLQANFQMPPHHGEINVLTMTLNGNHGRRNPKQVVSMAWLEEPRWLLVVKQDFSEAFNEVNHANYAVLLFLHLSAATILIVAVLIGRHMIKVIKRRDQEADELNLQLNQTAKLASIGQLSAGVAHEINNPLAIILTERQILADAVEQEKELPSAFQLQLADSLNQIELQIHRCKRITTNLLRFSRRTKSVIEPVQLNEFLSEMIELMEREARAGGIKFFAELDPELPPMLSDPSQLQQVFLNIITNAIDAHEGKPYGNVTIRTSCNGKGQAPPQGVWVQVKDTGQGIAPHHLAKIFDPFFTTKPVGKGTGLGLSICYSTIKRLGGEIKVSSIPGEGTEFSIFLPVQPPAALMEKMGMSARGGTLNTYEETRHESN